MSYRMRYSDEEFEEFEDCRDALITMQESGKAELLDILEQAVRDKGEGDEEYAAMLRAGIDFVRECLMFAEEHIEFDVCGIDGRFIDPYIEGSDGE